MKKYILFFLCVFMASCTSFSNLSTDRQLLYTRVEFNALVSSYTQYYDKVDKEEQAKLHNDVDQKILDAIKLLDAMDFAISIKDFSKYSQNEEEFLKMKNDILDIIAPLLVEKEK